MDRVRGTSGPTCVRSSTLCLQQLYLDNIDITTTGSARSRKDAELNRPGAGGLWWFQSWYQRALPGPGGWPGRCRSISKGSPVGFDGGRGRVEWPEHTRGGAREGADFVAAISYGCPRRPLTTSTGPAPTAPPPTARMLDWRSHAIDDALPPEPSPPRTFAYGMAGGT